MAAVVLAIECSALCGIAFPRLRKYAEDFVRATSERLGGQDVHVAVAVFSGLPPLCRYASLERFPFEAYAEDSVSLFLDELVFRGGGIDACATAEGLVAAIELLNTWSALCAREGREVGERHVVLVASTPPALDQPLLRNRDARHDGLYFPDLEEVFIKSDIRLHCCLARTDLNQLSMFVERVCSQQVKSGAKWQLEANAAVEDKTVFDIRFCQLIKTVPRRGSAKASIAQSRPVKTKPKAAVSVANNDKAAHNLPNTSSGPMSIDDDTVSLQAAMNAINDERSPVASDLHGINQGYFDYDDDDSELMADVDISDPVPFSLDPSGGEVEQTDWKSPGLDEDLRGAVDWALPPPAPPSTPFTAATGDRRERLPAEGFRLPQQVTAVLPPSNTSEAASIDAPLMPGQPIWNGTVSWSMLRRPGPPARVSFNALVFPINIARPPLTISEFMPMPWPADLTLAGFVEIAMPILQDVARIHRLPFITIAPMPGESNARMWAMLTQAMESTRKSAFVRFPAQEGSSGHGMILAWTKMKKLIGVLFMRLPLEPVLRSLVIVQAQVAIPAAGQASSQAAFTSFAPQQPAVSGQQWMAAQRMPQAQQFNPGSSLNTSAWTGVPPSSALGWEEFPQQDNGGVAPHTLVDKQAMLSMFLQQDPSRIRTAQKRRL